MDKVLITKEKLDSLATNIGIKSETKLPLSFDDMITAVQSIQNSNTSISLQSKIVTPSMSSFTVNADEGYDGLLSVTIKPITNLIDIKTITNSNNQATTLSFNNLLGKPKIFFLSCISSLSRFSTNSYYYIATIRYNGTNVYGTVHARSSGQLSNVTTGYSYNYNNGTITFTSTGSRGSSPGSFFNGTYELIYIY